jgi:hypothetical protein
MSNQAKKTIFDVVSGIEKSFFSGSQNDPKFFDRP